MSLLRMRSRTTRSAPLPTVRSALSRSAWCGASGRICSDDLRELGIESPFPLFAHQREAVLLRVPEETHPQLVVRRLVDEVWRVVEHDAARLQRLIRRVELRHPEIENRAVALELGCLRRAEHEPNPRTIEERERRRSLEQEPHAQRVAIKPHGSPEIAHRDGDLADRPEPEPEPEPEKERLVLDRAPRAYRRRGALPD